MTADPSLSDQRSRGAVKVGKFMPQFMGILSSRQRVVQFRRFMAFVAETPPEGSIEELLGRC